MRRVWVDTDIALGASRGDVDDGFALAAVALAERALPESVRLEGVSVVSGNTDAVTAAGAARRLLDTIGGRFADVSVVAEGDAPRALAALEPNVSVLAIGPPTNLVQAAAIDPGLPSRVDVRAVGTVVDKISNPILPLFDLNFLTDRAASDAFFSLPWRQRRIFPLEVVRRLRFGKATLSVIASTGTVGTYLSAQSRRWLVRAPFRYGRRSFPVWDLVAALDAIGHLPDARFDDRQRLRKFGVDAALRRFLGLLSAS